MMETMRLLSPERVSSAGLPVRVAASSLLLVYHIFSSMETNSMSVGAALWYSRVSSVLQRFVVTFLSNKVLSVF